MTLDHRNRRGRKKILWISLLLILLGILLTIYLYIPLVPSIDTIEKIATSSVVVNKPIANEIGPFLSITPRFITQGDPALITVEGLTSTSTVRSFTINNRPLVMFLHEGRVTALFGVDLKTAPGIMSLVLTFKDGRQIQENLIINERPVIGVPYDIPEKLGGNTPESEKELISTLATEGKIINAIPTSGEKLWTESFGLPLKDDLIVSDPYGYTRIIGRSTMPHKGVDLKADMGTAVLAMNRGVVRFADYLRNYGNTVVIDHGLGLQTVYLHLAKIDVTNNQLVKKGEQIGLSGDTGYVLGPHLHLSVKIWDISVDPMKFLELFGSKD